MGISDQVIAPVCNMLFSSSSSQDLLFSVTPVWPLSSLFFLVFLEHPESVNLCLSSNWRQGQPVSSKLFLLAHSSSPFLRPMSPMRSVSKCDLNHLQGEEV